MQSFDGAAMIDQYILVGRMALDGLDNKPATAPVGQSAQLIIIGL